MVRKKIVIAWYISSFSPLWILMAVKVFPFEKICGKFKEKGFLNSFFEFKCHHITNFIPSIFFLLLAFFSTRYIIKKIKKEYEKDTSHRFNGKIETASVNNSLSLDYLATYIVSLGSLDFDCISDVVIFILLCLFLGNLYVKHDMFKYNPTMEFLGFTLYDCCIIDTERFDSKGNVRYPNMILMLQNKGKKNILKIKMPIMQFTDDVMIGSL